MTDRPDLPNNSGGRHRPAAQRSRRRLVPLVVVAVLALGGVTSLFFLPRDAGGDNTAATATPTPMKTAKPTNAADSAAELDATGIATATVAATNATSTPAACPVSGGGLSVVAAPGIVDAIQKYWDTNVDSACSLTVTAEPVDTLAVLATDPPDVWVPDSSVWIDRAVAAGFPAPISATSAAMTPIVLALSNTAAATVGEPLNLHRILATRGTAAPIRLGLPDPGRQVVGPLALADVRAALTTEPDRNAALTWALRSSPAGLPTDSALSYLTADPSTAIASTEQAVWRYNQSASSRAQAVYTDPVQARLDFPFAVLTTDPERRQLAEQLGAGLRSPAGASLLDAAGLRDSSGAAGPALTGAPGINPAVTLSPDMPGQAAADESARDLALSNAPSRMLAVLDISGSMAEAVPDAGGATRIDLAKTAATRGLALYSADSEIGVWAFSRRLTGDVDYEELVPVGLLSDAVNGVSGDQRVHDAVTNIQVLPSGDTGLYDTALAAVRAMQANYEPGRVNSVLLLTDGRNDDPGSIGLPELLTTLAAEQDPQRPVPVIALAFGPQSDVTALDQITAATGGATYVALDPRQIGEIFLDAVGRRLCRPHC